MLASLLRQLRPETLIGGSAAVALIALLAGYLYVLKPSIVPYRELARARSEALRELAADRENTDRAAIAALHEKVEEVRKRLYSGSSDVPLKQIESHVIGALDQISGRHDVELMSVTPGEMTHVLMFDELPYDVHVEGSYFRLFEWFRDVESELRPMVVQQFEMNRSERAQGASLKLRLVAYRAQDSDT